MTADRASTTRRLRHSLAVRFSPDCGVRRTAPDTLAHHGQPHPDLHPHRRRRRDPARRHELTTKTDLRLAAYADVDEANAHSASRVAAGRLDDDVVAVLTHVQNDLFDVGADLCTPVVADPEFPPLRVEQDYVDRLEGWCDDYNEALRGAALVHPQPAAPSAPPTCTSPRTVCRRAERSAWAAYDVHGETMNQLAITYLNRLSDLLFILARHANREQGDVLWVPGGRAVRSAPSSSKPETRRPRRPRQPDPHDRVGPRLDARR